MNQDSRRKKQFIPAKELTEKKEFRHETGNIMKEPIPLDTWEDFEKELVEINRRYERMRQEKELSHIVYPLFRGVKDSKYHLVSTLDRIKERTPFSEYLAKIKIVHKHIVTCTGKRFDLDKKVNLAGLDLPAYEFMAYLRHNGFPSPLIDWTKSPYIAAYFAFRDITSKAKSVSIFVNSGKILYGQQPCIRGLGPTIATDHKHFLQQSEYSICTENQKGKTYFANHEDVKNDEDENFLVEYDIPASERQKVLRELNSMNITAYSLFDSEQSLMETLSVRELFLN